MALRSLRQEASQNSLQSDSRAVDVLDSSAVEVIIVVSSAVGKAGLGAGRGCLACGRGCAGRRVWEAELASKAARLLQRLRKGLHSSPGLSLCCCFKVALVQFQRQGACKPPFDEASARPD